jgi:hypothetical protein
MPDIALKTLAGSGESLSKSMWIPKSTVGLSAGMGMANGPNLSDAQFGCHKKLKGAHYLPPGVFQRVRLNRVKISLLGLNY